MSGNFTYFLFDNGSFRADATRSLRSLAARLAVKLGENVHAVSLLHSTRIPAAELDGIPAQLLEPALDAWFAVNPDGGAVLLPLFFGPSGALVDYVPERMISLRARHPAARMILAEPMVLPDEEPVELVAILADRARRAAKAKGWTTPKVVLCDHGTPLATVTAVRNRLGSLLAEALRGYASEVGVASMERREGDEFAFNEPLLATRLRTPPFNAGEVVVLLQFLSPGRHAGPGGDVAEICAAAEAEMPALTTAMSDPIADDPRLVEVLARRAQAARIALSN
jgi:sirohydrochlorin ferrochelatase